MQRTTNEFRVLKIPWIGPEEELRLTVDSGGISGYFVRYRSYAVWNMSQALLYLLALPIRWLLKFSAGTHSQAASLSPDFAIPWSDILHISVNPKRSWSTGALPNKGSLLIVNKDRKQQRFILTPDSEASILQEAIRDHLPIQLLG